MNRPIIALDFTNTSDLSNFITSHCQPEKVILKIGLATFNTVGPDYVRGLVEQGYDVFLDLKFHDIPQQVKLACQAAAEIGVWMINVHTLGGIRMMQAATEGVLQASKQPLLIGVTILTSHEETELPLLGLNKPLTEQVTDLAMLAVEAGLDGVVCSAQEAAMLRDKCGNDFILVTPGIRLQAPADGDDQRRVMTPRDAIAAGSSYIVVGRPITQADKPVDVIDEILSQIN